MLQEMIEEGEAVEGAMFRAAHAVSDRKTVDWKAVAAKFNPSRQLVNAHTKVTEVHAIRVSSRVANAA
jgi:DNA-directed RNA polymerase subunit L